MLVFLVEINFAKEVTREVSLEFDDGDVLGALFLWRTSPNIVRVVVRLGIMMWNAPLRLRRVVLVQMLRE